MELFQGNEGFGEVALGTIKVLKKEKVFKAPVADSKSAIEEYEIAKSNVISMIEHEKDQLEHSLIDGSKNPATLDSQLMLINDHQLEDAIIARIYNQGCSAKQAISLAGDYLSDVLSKQNDGYLKSKASDIIILKNRLLSCLKDYNDVDAYLTDDSIIAVRELSSSEFLKLDREKIKGLIIEKTSSNSHAAILAKAIGIPTIIGCEISDDWDGKKACIDGGWRVLYLEPDEATIQDMNDRIDADLAKKQKLQELKGKVCATKDGRIIHVYANISSTLDINSAIDNDAEGIGLYRTEAAFLNRITPPHENELFYEYRSLAKSMGSKSTIIRTVDLSSNKDIPYVSISEEENSALGLRGIRFCFRYLDIFKTQIRAILRAAAYGNLAIMFPMISSLKEFTKAKDIVEECYHELIADDVPCKLVNIGVMVETPASVLISDELAKYAAFISIGTNDLTQYTLGVDRENKAVADICDYRHPAILKMLKIVCDNAHRYNVPVGISGELAYDEELIEYYLEIGIDSLSVAPFKVLSIRNHVLSL